MYRDKLEEVLDKIDEIIVLGSIEVTNYLVNNDELFKPLIDYIFKQKAFKDNIEELYSILMGRLKEHYSLAHYTKRRYPQNFIMIDDMIIKEDTSLWELEVMLIKRMMKFRGISNNYFELYKERHDRCYW